MSTVRLWLDVETDLDVSRAGDHLEVLPVLGLTELSCGEHQRAATPSYSSTSSSESPLGGEISAGTPPP